MPPQKGAIYNGFWSFLEAFPGSLGMRLSHIRDAAMGAFGIAVYARGPILAARRNVSSPTIRNAWP